MAKALKQMLAAQLLGALKGSDGAVFVDPGPMTVEQVTRLRGVLRQKAGGARLRRLHNRTARAAFKEAGWPDTVGTVLKGATAVVYGGEGTTTIAKTLAEATKADKTLPLKVKGAVSEGEFYDAKSVAQTLAKLPDKKTLRAMLCGAILGPARGLAVVLAAPASGVVRGVQARVEKGGGETPAPAVSESPGT
jgi:ribosomal protein L10